MTLDMEFKKTTKKLSSGTALPQNGGVCPVDSWKLRVAVSSAQFLKEIIIFSRDELKQEQMRQRLNHSKIKFHIGDIRDRGSVDDAMTGVDYVFYAVAMKQVPSCEKEFRTEVMKIAGARYTLVRTLILSGGVGTMGQNSSTRNRA